MNAVIQNVNIRGHEVKNNAKGEPYILVHFEDETGAPSTVVDKNMERADLYVRDTNADIQISIDDGRKFTTVRVVGLDVK